MAINTKKVPNRRVLRFNSIEEIAKDVISLAEKGEPQFLGNWSPTQILDHLTTIQNGAIAGLEIKVPWFVRLMTKVLKSWVLDRTMPAGYKMPESIEKQTRHSANWLEAVKNFNDSINKLKIETNRKPHPFLGAITNEEWDKLLCRHAELHLGFLLPKS